MDLCYLEREWKEFSTLEGIFFKYLYIHSFLVEENKSAPVTAELYMIVFSIIELLDHPNSQKYKQKKSWGKGSLPRKGYLYVK